MDAKELEAVRQVVNLANRAWRDIFPNDRLGEGSFLREHGDGRLVTCRLGDETVGTLTVEADDDSLWISLLAVVPAHTGRGIGSALITYAEALARQEGLTWLKLDAVDRGRLVSYYVRQGFAVFDRTSHEAGKWRSTQPFDLVSLRRPVVST